MRYLAHGDPDDLTAAAGWWRVAAAAEAASTSATSVAADRADAAITVLEQGRGVLWGQLLDIRADLAGLAAAAPGIARRLAEIRRSLD
jgi:hypothetical protein